LLQACLFSRPRTIAPSRANNFNQGYGYNAAGQLTTMTLPSGAAIGFGYNANNEATSVTLNGSNIILNAITYEA